MLHSNEIRAYQSQGIIGPYDLLSAEEVGNIKTRIEQETAKPGLHHEADGFRHLDCPSVYQLCAQAKIVERMAALLGPDLVLWRTQLFRKPPGAKAIPWHQDAINWPLAPGNTISAWIALDDASRSNGCLEMLPGQQQKMMPQHAVEGFERFTYEADTSEWDLAKSQFMELRAGQFILFDDHIPHRSGANLSDSHRLGLAMRVITPQTVIDRSRFFPEFSVLLLKGSHSKGVNPLGVAPVV